MIYIFIFTTIAISLVENIGVLDTFAEINDVSKILMTHFRVIRLFEDTGT